jgi:predicted transcriptional regulator of viral defense system
MATETHFGIEFDVRTLGAQESRIVLSMEEEGQSVIDVDQAAHILGSRTKANKVLIRLNEKGWLERSGRGRYMLHSSRTGHLAVRVASPLKYASSVSDNTYIGWWSAARYHKLTWQQPMLIRVASLKQVKPRMYEEFRIEFVKLSSKKFFGFEYSRIDGLTVSTIPKTVVDCVDKPEYAGGLSETGIIVGTACDRVGTEAIIADVIKADNKSAMQRLGFLLDCAVPHLLADEARKRLLHAIGDPVRMVVGSPKVSNGDFGYVADWGMQANLNKDMFLYELDRFGKSK